MDHFRYYLDKISKVTTYMGGAFLIGIMTLTVASIVSRLLGKVVLGSYELVELMMVVTAGFALVHTTIRKGHVIVEIILSRLSKRAQIIAEIFHNIIATGLWGLIAWETLALLIEKGFLGEGRTEVIEAPYFPVKLLWTIALILCSLIFLMNVLNVVFGREQK